MELLVVTHSNYKICTLSLFSVSSGEDNLEKLQELERALAQAQHEKMRLMEDQVTNDLIILSSDLIIRHYDLIIS